MVDKATQLAIQAEVESLAQAHTELIEQIHRQQKALEILMRQASLIMARLRVSADLAVEQSDG